MICFDGSIWICLDGISCNLCCQEDFFHANFLDAGPDEEKTDVIPPKPAGPSVVGMEAFVRKVLESPRAFQRVTPKEGEDWNLMLRIRLCC